MDQVVAHLIDLNRSHKGRLIRVPFAPEAAAAVPAAASLVPVAQQSTPKASPAAPEAPANTALPEAVPAAQATADASQDTASVGATKGIELPAVASEPPKAEKRRSGIWPFSR